MGLLFGGIRARAALLPLLFVLKVVVDVVTVTKGQFDSNGSDWAGFVLAGNKLILALIIFILEPFLDKVVNYSTGFAALLLAMSQSMLAWYVADGGNNDNIWYAWLALGGCAGTVPLVGLCVAMLLGIEVPKEDARLTNSDTSWLNDRITSSTASSGKGVVKQGNPLLKPGVDDEIDLDYDGIQMYGYADAESKDKESIEKTPMYAEDPDGEEADMQEPGVVAVSI